MARVIYIAAGTSEVIVSPTEILNDGVDSATITVRVKDSRGNPVQGLDASQVVIASTGTGNTITQPTGVTDINGEITGSIVSTGIATKTISATVCGLAITDTASLSVAASVDWLANLPSGVSLVSARAFTTAADMTSNGSFGSESGFTDATAPYSPTGVARFVYPAGAAAGFGTGSRDCNVAASTVRHYVSFNFKLSANYTMHPSGLKVVYAFRATDQSIGSYIFSIRPSAGETDYETGLLRFGFDAQTGDGVLAPNDNVVAPVRDQWYHAEIVAVMETSIGAGDGTFQMWLDGVRLYNLTNVDYVNSGTLEWRDIALDPYYGGNTPGHTIAETCYLYVDQYDVYSSTARS